LSVSAQASSTLTTLINPSGAIVPVIGGAFGNQITVMSAAPVAATTTTATSTATTTKR
jgi:hypothetical protein